MKLYQIARIFRIKLAAKDLLPGGNADFVEDSYFNSESLEAGIEEEMSEHTNSKQVAKEIVKDHLIKDPEKYDDDED